MFCPLKPQAYDSHEGCYPNYSCDKEDCSWWDSKANYNPETKQFEGQCCILTLSRLKISGGINTHAY
jgi:hypothetical protein